MDKVKPPVCLTIAGLDPSGGAGILADVRTFARFGCFPTAVVSALTYQNTNGVYGSVAETRETVLGQAKPVFDDFEIAAIKTGMLPTAGVIETVAQLMKEYPIEDYILDPVIRSTSGFDLIDDKALRSLVKYLFPLALLITPNIPEAERITGIAIESDDDIKTAAEIMHSMGARNVLIKGGHGKSAEYGVWDEELKRKERVARDFLFSDKEVKVFETEFIQTTSTHGTGCVLSAAIAANLALGRDIIEAVQIAKDFVTQAIRMAPSLGHGHSPINI